MFWIENRDLLCCLTIVLIIIFVSLLVGGEYMAELISKRSKLSDSYITFQIRKFIIYLDKHYIITDENGDSVYAKDILEKWEDEK